MVTSPGSQVSTASEFGLTDAAIEAVVKRSLRKSFGIATAEWRVERAKEISSRRLGLRRWIRRMLSSGRNGREQTEVKSGYEGHWTQKDALERYVAGLDQRALCVEWRDMGMHLAPQALRHVHLLYLMNAIEVLRPRSVLEVGFGNGNLLLTLAARFPEVAFHGIELTESGLATAQDMQHRDELPAAFVDASPEPLRDTSAHRWVRLQTGDARALPFADGEIDMVYSRLALEQMEAIRHQVLSEITRVTAKAVVLIEPWRDFNLDGPGRDYIRRQGYFAARIKDLKGYGFKVVYATDDLPQKVQFKAGPVVALRA